eukprot:CAMPEP_0184700890 /NCGR_PEP_ID=MMETSP0313-20130426/16648_1 /TAXON_ID=2792 /ORGANISM="Porphyridium aerugineum, Strain SAG 1380-2" /LENGTH=788 /DNA_ID=CAMNT_0027160733 /DNA_START=314 /DNA_END=2680 /DNA_ORIENTATION=-
MERIAISIEQARYHKVKYRAGGELEVSGYGCEDHFFETDTFEHSWQVIARLFDLGVFENNRNMLIDIGMPVIHQSASYNSRVLVLDGKIVLIRPKVWLADDGNYRESRWFRAWPPSRGIEQYLLPEIIEKRTGQKFAPIGNAILQGLDCSLAIETCEELFVPQPPHQQYGLHGVELVSNGSGSHHSLRKLKQRLDLITSATRRTGGAYVYANLIGCDGGRLYYDGCNMIVLNGELLAQGEQFSLESECFITYADVDLDAIQRYRINIVSRGVQAASLSMVNPIPKLPLLMRDGSLFSFCKQDAPAKIGRSLSHKISDSSGHTKWDHNEEDYEHVDGPLGRSLLEKLPPIQTEFTRPLQSPRVYLPQEEIALGPACWLWDYLRRSSLRGFLLPLSGGADSSATAALVGSMCLLVFEAIQMGKLNVLEDLRRITRKTTLAELQAANSEQAGTRNELDISSLWVPSSPQEIANEIFVTLYLGSENMSSKETRQRSKDLAAEVGSYHLDLNIWPAVEAILTIFQSAFPNKGPPKFKVYGGTYEENQALQNIQARIRMVISYLIAQLAPWARGQGSGTLLVLSSANVDEALRGYLTKYDCSAADINPIGGISKADLKLFLQWAATTRDKSRSSTTPGVLGGGLGLKSLKAVLEAAPTAELEPITVTHVQTDEADMGMTYDELSIYGRLRKVKHCGPVSMFYQLVREWSVYKMSPLLIAEKVKFFFKMYSINRHKLTTLTPSYHAESYSPEDNRFDLRQFLYNTKWTWAFAIINKAARRLEKQQEAEATAKKVD